MSENKNESERKNNIYCRGHIDNRFDLPVAVSQYWPLNFFIKIIKFPKINKIFFDYDDNIKITN